jgi:hypothetical protein
MIFFQYEDLLFRTKSGFFTGGNLLQAIRFSFGCGKSLPEKQCSHRVSTNKGMQIDGSDGQRAKAQASTHKM